MDISVLGRVGYDLYSEEPGVPLQNVTRFSRHLGGSSANIAVGLQRLGSQTGIISCVGDDPLGRYLIDFLAKEGVDIGRIQTKASFLSSLCLTEVCPPDRFAQVFYRELAADTQLEIGIAERDLIQSTELFITNGTSLCASPSRESTLAALEWAKQGCKQVAFDVDYRPSSWPSEDDASRLVGLALPFVDILLGNLEEIRMVAKMDDLDSAISWIRSRGVGLVVAKLGEAGVQAVSDREALKLHAFPTQVVCTIGAGDGFAAGFLHALLQGRSLAQALCYGNAAAAVVVGQVMCAEAMPSLGELEAVLEGHEGIQPESL